MSISLDTEFVRSTIELFEKKAANKAENDKNNKSREAAVGFLLGEDKLAASKLTEDPHVGERWKIVESNLRECLISIPEALDSDTNFEFAHLIHRGGRSTNFDFDAVYSHKSSSAQKTESVEFKFGKSIYDQPQFLSVYAKTGTMITSDSEPFAEYFYDNFAPKLAQLAKVELPERGFYLSKIYGTSRDVDPFFVNLHIFKMESKSNKEKLKEISNTAISEYLKTFSDKTNSLDFEAINDLFRNQIVKRFVSWDHKTKTAKLEFFEEGDMTIADEFELKLNRKGQRTSLVFTNSNEKKIQALLRWKNHACILGPGWQVYLKRK